MSSGIELLEPMRQSGSSSSEASGDTGVSVASSQREMQEIGPTPADELGESEVTYPDGGLQAWLVVVGCFFGMIADFGLANTYGAIAAYVATHQLEAFSTVSISWIFSVNLGIMFLFNIFGGVIFDELGARRPMIVGTIMMFAGIFATGNCTQPYQFILSFGVLAGTGSGLCMSPLVGVVSHWFINRRGLAMGLALTGASTGGIFIPLMLDALYASVGFTWGMRILAFTVIAELGISIVLIKERPGLREALRKRSAERDGDEESDVEVAAEDKSVIFFLKNLVDFSAFKEAKYTLCVIASMALECGLICSLTFFPTYALNVAKSSETVSFNLVSIVNATSVIGRCIPNYISDKYGVFNVFIVMTAGCFFIQCVLWLGFGSNLTVLYVFAVFYGFFSASVVSMIPVSCAAVSPTKHFGKRYATLYFAMGPLIMFATPVAGAIIGDGTKSRFDHYIIFVSCLSAVGLASLIATRYVISGSAKVFMKV